MVDEPTRREGPTWRDLRATDERLPRGSVVGRYVVLDVLGTGGMGVVYGGYDPELDRKVAIKLLQAKADGSRGDQAWLARTVRSSSRVATPTVRSTRSHRSSSSPWATRRWERPRTWRPSYTAAKARALRRISSRSGSHCTRRCSEPGPTHERISRAPPP